MLQEIEKQIGSFNRIEKIYALIFVLSIASGIIYGTVFDRNYYKCCESTLSLQPGQNNFTIFSNNFLLASIALITAGFSSFYFLFVTFAISASSFAANGELLGIAFLLLLGSLELVGVFLFGLAGFFVFERKILKIKSKLIAEKLVLIATVLIFISSIFEYLVTK